jgi:hypothetical protein
MFRTDRCPAKSPCRGEAKRGDAPSEAQASDTNRWHPQSLRARWRLGGGGKTGTRTAFVAVTRGEPEGSGSGEAAAEGRP